MNKEQSKIPTGKVKRATRFIKTGAKVGGNYLKHYTKKAFDSDLSNDELDKKNAEEIFETLAELKGSALKIVQMVSMDKNILPKTYTDVFSLAQNSAPPLSFPLIVKTFKDTFGKSPSDLFDSFSKNAAHAASIGQVHFAEKDGQKYAVKIQYPGVADSINDDLNMVRPIASMLSKVPSDQLDEYFNEIKDRLVEETDYELELKRTNEIASACKDLEGLFFPVCYPELSSKRVLTMAWLDGMQLDEFLNTNPSQEIRNKIAQQLWHFYDYQIHKLKKVHADPHPGNYLFRADGSVGILDFGCVKEFPEDFYKGFFPLIVNNYLHDEGKTRALFLKLGFIVKEDSEEEMKHYYDIFKEGVELLGKPFHQGTFDFGDDDYFEKIFKMGEKVAKQKYVFRSKRTRGSKHAIYLNRTYFGLYRILNKLNANIETSTIYQT